MPDGSNQKVKVKVRINLNGIFTVSSASLIEKQVRVKSAGQTAAFSPRRLTFQEVEEEVPMEVEEPAKADAGVNENGPESADKKPQDAEMADAEQPKPDPPK